MTNTPGTFLNLVLVLDLHSRYPFAWMVAKRENIALAKQLFATAIKRYGIAPGTITVHNNRGEPMTATSFIHLLTEPHSDRSMSRHRVSNDNSYSESCFKTNKVQPDYPGRFCNLMQARRWLTESFGGYTNQHRHSSLAHFAPAEVLFGRVCDLALVRQDAIDATYQHYPVRFVQGPPRVRRPPVSVAIHPIDLTLPTSLTEWLCAGDAAFTVPNPEPVSDPVPVLLGAPSTTSNST